MKPLNFSRRGALICLSGLIAAPFVIRNAGALMPVRNRLLLSKTELERRTPLGIWDWTLCPPTVAEVKAWRTSMNSLIARRIMVSWTGEGFAPIHRMADAEKYYRAMGLL